MARSTTTETSDVTLEELNKQMHVLKNDIATLTSTLGAFGKAKGEEAIGHAQSQARAARDLTAEQIEALTTQATQFGHDLHSQADSFVRKQPATALGIAAGAGFLIGLLTSRR